jgi:hypothetical protein
VLVESFDEVFNRPLTYNYNIALERELSTNRVDGARRVRGIAVARRTHHG